MVAKKASADTAVKTAKKKETKKKVAKNAVAAKNAEGKTKDKKIAATEKETVKKPTEEKAAKTAAKKVAVAKPANSITNKIKESKTVQAAVKKTEEKSTKPVTPKVTSIFKAIETGDLVSFKALIATQKNKRGEAGRTPLMVVSLIRSNPRMTDGSNYETKRVKNGKDLYDKMYQMLIEAHCDKNAMDDAGNTARDYNYGGILNQMLAD